MAVSKLGYKAFSLYEGQAIKRQPGVDSVGEHFYLFEFLLSI